MLQVLYKNVEEGELGNARSTGLHLPTAIKKGDLLTEPRADT